ncbi:18722_t:CDS:2, partial [Funneliformis geosporum]
EMVSENGQNNNTIDLNTNTINSNTSEVLFSNIQVFDSVIDQLNNEVEQADDDMIPKESLDENQIVKQGIMHELCSSILPEDNINSTKITDPCVSLENMVSDSTQHLSYLFETAIKSNQHEILVWHNYSIEFESKARKHLILFGKNGVGIDKIKLVSYSVTKISKLINAQIQNVIDQVKKYTSVHQSHMTLKTDPSGNDQIKAEYSVKITSMPRLHYFKNNALWDLESFLNWKSCDSETAQELAEEALKEFKVPLGYV